MNIEIQMMEIVRVLGNSDRTQASNMTKIACQYLQDYVNSCQPSVCSRILEFSTSPNDRPLGFDVPASWELVSGNVSFSFSDASSLQLNHADFPMLIATNSRAFSGNLSVCTLANPSLKGKLVLLQASEAPFSVQLAKAAAGNAAGVASAAFSSNIRQAVARGRIELPADTSLFALSLTQPEYHSLTAALAAGMVSAEVSINTDQSGCVPVLEIRTHPDANKEILLCAHICHLRPGANDNASGVAVLCELLSNFARFLPPVRIVFAPEFTGMSAYLDSTGFKPVFVINVDMVGGDPVITGAQLELECAPSYLHHPLQELLISIFRETHGLAFHITEFKGFSDHALFASKAIAVPAVLIGQTGDAYNHTDLDRIENLCPKQMAIICRLLARFLIKAGPFYDAGGFPVPSRRTNNTGPFNIYNLLNACDETTAADIRMRLASDKGTYARLQRAYLDAQWEQQSSGDLWAEDVIARLGQTRASDL